LKQPIPQTHWGFAIRYISLFESKQCRHVEEEGISEVEAVVVGEEVVEEAKRQADLDLIDDLTALDLQKTMGKFKYRSI
jgi:acetolactate synthase small subunit